MATHAEVIVAAPDRNVPFGAQRLGIIICHWELCSAPVHGLEHAVGVVVLLLLDFLLKELVIAKVGDR